MTDRVPADQIESIVGVPRSETAHYGRAVSDEQTVYILHSHQCKQWHPDLRECPFSLALDRGIDVARWVEDQPVRLCIEQGRLLPDPTERRPVSARADLADVLMDALLNRAPSGALWIHTDDLHPLRGHLADAIIAAGWVPRTQMALVRDSVRDVSQARLAERDALAATVARVAALLTEWDHGDNPEADDDWRTDPLGCCADALRAALDGGDTP